MRWIAGGIAGWLAAVVPLLGVNIAGYANLFDTDTAVIAGAVALIGSILLGGLVAGLIAGRSSTSRAGGAATSLPAGIVAAGLYVVSLMTVVFFAIHTGAAPAVVAEHPLRITGAVICLGTILLGMSLLFGVLAGKRVRYAATQTRVAARSDAQHGKARPQVPSQPRNEGYSRQPTRGAYPGANAPGVAGREGYGRHSGYGGYGGYDERQPSRHPSSPSSHQGDVRGRDDDWREARR
jgi:hypothetical protein